jgi:membrane-bound ClpP family serine protease
LREYSGAWTYCGNYLNRILNPLSLTAIILLIVLGLIFILLELLIVPGSTVVGIIGAVLMIAGIGFVFAKHGSIGLTLLLVFIGIKTNTWKRFSLETKLHGKVNTFEHAELNVGDSGKTVSRLAPSGKALINGNYVEVHTQGEFIDPNTDIIIAKRTESKLIVTTKTT